MDIDNILECIVPKKNDVYSLDEIDTKLKNYNDRLTTVLHKENDRFDVILDNSETQGQLQNLFKHLHNVQLNFINLQCDIELAKETLGNLYENQLIKERRDILKQEENLKRTIQQIKFEPVDLFFNKLADVIHKNLLSGQKTCALQHFGALFDWTQFHNVIFLLKLCGKALLDINKFEILYQSNIDIISLNFKQSLDRLDFNQFIDFRNNYSLESFLEVTTPTHRRIDLKELLSDSTINLANKPVEFLLFEDVHSRLESITIDCCKLLVDLNLNYIEAHLTQGINIDKLNDSENDHSNEPALPRYAFAPQEYITVIGQHLLTLRKQTEQAEITDSESLIFAFKFLNRAQNIALDTEFSDSVTNMMLKCIARHCIRSLLGRTNNSVISKLTANGLRQLATDALYLDNVLEDLGLLEGTEPNVEKFKKLLVY